MPVYSGWLVIRCLRSLAGDIELFGNTSLHEKHRASGSISSPVGLYVHPQRQIGIIVLPLGNTSVVLLVAMLDGDVKLRHSLTTLVLTVIVLFCLLKLPLLATFHVIYKKQININLTARYFNDSSVNRNKYFSSLIGLIILTLYELRLNGTYPWWWKSQLEITKIYNRLNNVSLLISRPYFSFCVHMKSTFQSDSYEYIPVT